MCRGEIVFTTGIVSLLEPALYGVTDGKAVGTYLEPTSSNSILMRNTKKEEGIQQRELIFRTCSLT